VRPPQKPTIKKRNKSDFDKSDLDSSPKKKPIKKQPIILTKKVDIGNSPLLYGKNFPIRYLKDVPIPPPRKITNNCFNFVLEI